MSSSSGQGIGVVLGPDLPAKGGDKVITEPHLLGDKHYSGGEATVMKGIDRLTAEVANLSIKDTRGRAGKAQGQQALICL